VLAVCGFWLLFSPKSTCFPVRGPPPERHGDSAMCMRFWCESSARPGENLCDTVVANFLIHDQRLLPRAFHTKARSHCTIAAPLRWLVWLAWRCKKPGEWSIMIEEFGPIFMAVQNKPNFPQTESACDFREIVVKFLYRSDRCKPQVLRAKLL
jgi:hypothetical protein